MIQIKPFIDHIKDYFKKDEKEGWVDMTGSFCNNSKEKIVHFKE